MDQIKIASHLKNGVENRLISYPVAITFILKWGLMRKEFIEVSKRSTLLFIRMTVREIHIVSYRNTSGNLGNSSVWPSELYNHGQNHSDKNIKYKECSSKNPLPLPWYNVGEPLRHDYNLLTFETATLYQGGGDAAGMQPFCRWKHPCTWYVIISHEETASDCH